MNCIVLNIQKITYLPELSNFDTIRGIFSEAVGKGLKLPLYQNGLNKYLLECAHAYRHGPYSNAM